jgi:glycine/D-amino acid oxidase-like deaminating enzyme
MNVSDERTVSVWASTEVAPDAMPLAQDETVDVVVVGSGIAGMSVAYELAVAGQRVAVIDRGKIGSGMTARTTVRARYPTATQRGLALPLAPAGK